ncbi:hypothetical protein DPMN_156020 [Dreissena polymorpha]|uniref:Uncharacterized protein n=1 Tax=Dreissena polymorpha TaxID=45954 RepID=A0A9D4FN94_DREPO|nr:hypothetical protein DPMN_156020 [Dreissena polymorpha]
MLARPSNARVKLAILQTPLEQRVLLMVPWVERAQQPPIARGQRTLMLARPSSARVKPAILQTPKGQSV